ncbi:Homeobox-leucine zipper protein ROC3-like protein [Drosera capensis]
MTDTVVTSDSLFSSPGRNPNFNFMTNMPFHPFSSLIPKEESTMTMIRAAKDEMDSLSGSEQIEGLSGNEQENDDGNQQQSQLQQPGAVAGQQPKKKRYHRHTARQIQEMEALFNECPHPDDKQRMKLSQELGLKPRQVKFWFQNRRTQMKVTHISVYSNLLSVIA